MNLPPTQPNLHPYLDPFVFFVTSVYYTFNSYPTLSNLPFLIEKGIKK